MCQLAYLPDTPLDTCFDTPFDTLWHTFWHTFDTCWHTFDTCWHHKNWFFDINFVVVLNTTMDLVCDWLVIDSRNGIVDCHLTVDECQFYKMYVHNIRTKESQQVWWFCDILMIANLALILLLCCAQYLILMIICLIVAAEFDIVFS